MFIKSKCLRTCLSKVYSFLTTRNKFLLHFTSLRAFRVYPAPFELWNNIGILKNISTQFQSDLMGDGFMNSVEKKLQQINEHPEYYSKKQSNNFREAKVATFPYMIVYELFKRKQLINVAAIYHSKRNPKRKYRGLK